MARATLAHGCRAARMGMGCCMHQESVAGRTTASSQMGNAMDWVAANRRHEEYGMMVSGTTAFSVAWVKTVTCHTWQEAPDNKCRHLSPTFTGWSKASNRNTWASAKWRLTNRV